MFFTLEKALHDNCSLFGLLKTDGDKQRLLMLRLIMDQLQLSFLASFEALDCLCQTILGRSKKGGLIFGMVNFFSTALESIHKISIRQAENEALLEGRLSPRSSGSTIGSNEYAVNKYLTGALVAILRSIDWKADQTGHSDVLEGILFHILGHIGRLLSNAVFAEHVAMSTSLAHITESNEVGDRIGKYEARYMVHILYTSLGNPEKRELVAQVLLGGKTSIESDIRCGGANQRLFPSQDFSVLAQVKSLIQSTLLRSAIGWSDQATLSSMKLPEADPDSWPTLAEFKEENLGSDWLVGAVLGILGWDIIV